MPVLIRSFDRPLLGVSSLNSGRSPLERPFFVCNAAMHIFRAPVGSAARISSTTVFAGDYAALQKMQLPIVRCTLNFTLRPGGDLLA
jgi:hypothetical protein